MDIIRTDIEAFKAKLSVENEEGITSKYFRDKVRNQETDKNYLLFQFEYYQGHNHVYAPPEIMMEMIQKSFPTIDEYSHAGAIMIGKYLSRLQKEFILKHWRNLKRSTQRERYPNRQIIILWNLIPILDNIS